MPDIQITRTATPRLPFVSTITRDLDEMQNRLRRAFNVPAYEPFAPSLVQSLGWNPAVEIAESPDEFTVMAELPGLAAKDVSADFENGVLTLRGERKLDREDKRDNYHRIELSYGTFTRSFSLPGTIDAEKIKAESKTGILTVYLPKKPEAKPKSIQVKVS